MSQRIRGEIAFIVNDAPVEISHPGENEKYLLSIINAIKELKFKSMFDLHSEELDNGDFVALYYNPEAYIITDVKYGFIIFNISSEVADLRDVMRVVLIVMVLAGIALSLIFILLFTAKLRKQISYLSEAASVTGKGDFDYRVKIISKDEIGLLGQAFNTMLDELKFKSDAEKEYSEFITLLNQNPTIHEVSDAVLEKIIKATGLTIGVLYLVESNDFRLLSSYGISKEHALLSQEVDYYKTAIKEKNFVERNFTKNYPIIKIGITEIKIEYLIVAPIIYNKEVIAILELASDSQPSRNIKDYITNIQEQFAIGLNNARSFEQLEDLVNELKKLNEDYQNQNKKILEKNEQLLELHKRLEEKAEELEKQKEKAIELTKLKSQFLANISHELRTPLNSIIGLTELVSKDQQILPNNKNRLDIVLRNGKKLLNLINNILEFLKIESGKLEIKKERFLLVRFLKEIHDFVEPLLVEKNLKFSIELESEHDYLIEADKSKIEQVLINLIGNAVKFTEKGRVKVKIDVLNDSDLQITVEDTGIGISEEFQKVIFEEFRQEDGGTTRKYSGTGLGLAICLKYIQLMGGSLKLSSEINRGSEFMVFIPGIIMEQIEASFDEKETELPSIDTNKFGRTVMILAQEEDTQKILSDYLVLNKFKVHVSTKPSDGMEYAKQNPLHAIVISSDLSGANSWLLLQDFKQNEVTKNIPVIMIHIMGDKKVGYGLSVFDYFFSIPSKDELLPMFNSISGLTKQQISSVAILDVDETNLKRLSKVVNDIGYANYAINEINMIKDKVQDDPPDAVLINLIIPDTDVIELIHKLKHTTNIKKVPIIVYCSKSLDGEDAELLKQNLEDVTIKTKHHPMDVLKILRDRLSIEYSKQTRSGLMVDESSNIVQTESKPEEVGKESDNKKRVLIVDDDSDTLFTIGEIVKDLGYETIYARNGVECLLSMNNIEPDIVLLDIMMPQMDGFETIKRIRLDDRFPDLPVIALTAYAMLDNKEVIEKNGFTDIITKPINTNTLAFKIQNLLKQKRAW
ncbi:response regulator [Bacteroidota bacterium]